MITAQATSGKPRVDLPVATGKTRSAAARSRNAGAGATDGTKSEIDIELLIFFNTVAETLSFTKAAQKLNIDQSWLSHKIRQLEGMLNVTLFIRNTRHVELTRSGLNLLEPVRKLAEFADQARKSAKMLAASIEGTLVVGALPFSFPDPGRNRLLDAFLTENPNVQLQVTNGSTPELLDQLRARKLDLAFVSAPIDDTDLDTILLRENAFCLLIPEEHPLAQIEDITVASLAGHSVVIPSPQFSPATFDSYYRPLLDAQIKAITVPEFQNAVAYADDWKVPIACTVFAATREKKEGMIIRNLPFIPTCKKYLVRLSNHRTPSQITLWNAALTM